MNFLFLSGGGREPLDANHPDPIPVEYPCRHEGGRQPVLIRFSLDHGLVEEPGRTRAALPGGLANLGDLNGEPGVVWKVGDRWPFERFMGGAGRLP